MGCGRMQQSAGSAEGEELLAELERAAKIEEIDAWETLDAFDPRRDGEVSEKVAQTRWVITRKVVDGRRSVRARLVAKGY